MLEPAHITRRGEFALVTVRFGAKSLRSLAHGETFHPVIGPREEAEVLHVAQQHLAERAAKTAGEFVIWDVGLGAAANATAVLRDLRELPAGAEVALHSFDVSTEPLRFALEHQEELGYFGAHAEAAPVLLENAEAQVGSIRWRLHLGDFAETMDSASAPHAVLYDPYSPASNPSMWSLPHFTRLRARLAAERPCILTNYSRSTAVRVTLLLAGFFVGRGTAIAEKNETTVAATDRRLLEAPLEADWLERVARSTRGGPLQDPPAPSAISPSDLEALRAHPQFRQS